MCYGDSFALSGDIGRTVEGFCKITQYKIEVAAYFLWLLQKKGRIKSPKNKGFLKRMLKDVRVFWQ